MPDRQNEALWCHVMMGGKVWQEVLVQREEGEESRIVQVLWSTELLLFLRFPFQGDMKGESPTVTFLTSIPVHVCETLLDYLTSWLAVTGWKEGYGAWIYAVLTRFIFPSLFLHIAGNYCLGWRSPWPQTWEANSETWHWNAPLSGQSRIQSRNIVKFQYLPTDHNKK